MADSVWLLQDSTCYVGNAVVWWVYGRCGYTTDIEKAHRFTEQEAAAQHRSRKTDIPWRLAEIEPLAQAMVDMQRLPRRGKG